ncbi:methylated-DNA--[protein]-cysteine S-methyltransferase [Clostridiaceae bacterium M8S5]|nr:methylated-DNA--[protein]-cysteine S-methyltransferase [Clostridiaceae bacterium M8S5]
MLRLYELNTDFCPMWAAFSDEGLIRLCISNEESIYDYSKKYQGKIIEKSKEKDNLLNNLNSYFSGELTQINIPLKIEGTDFQKSVWNELIKIPYGKVASYKDIAERIGNPKGCRAVGMANNKNKIPIIIPCHRIIGHSKELVGFAGGLEQKASLLRIEGHKIIIKETSKGKKYYLHS